MPLQDQIQSELKAAMLARNAERVATLRLLKSAIGYALIEAKVETLPDPEVQVILQREIKKRREAIELYEKGGRPELAAKERGEIAIIEGFLPKPLSPEELESLVRQTIYELGAASKKEMGAVIKGVQAKSAGRADGKTISALVARLLP